MTIDRAAPVPDIEHGSETALAAEVLCRESGAFADVPRKRDSRISR